METTIQPESKSYTAAQFAAALGVTAKAVKLRLVGIAPSGVVTTAMGRQASAWNVAQLPEPMRNELCALAERRGYASVDQLLADPPSRWQPRVPWHDVAQSFKDNAQKLCEALAPVLSAQHTVSGPELMEKACSACRQHFGHEITDAKLRYVMDRATKRDGGLCRFQSPELYLDDDAFQCVQSAPLDLKSLHEPLEDVIASLDNKADPTADDRAYLFHAAFEHFARIVAQFPSKGEQRSVKRSLVDFLYRCVPSLYRPQAAASSAVAQDKPLLAMRRLFNRLQSQWIAGGRIVSAINDARLIKSGNFRTPDFSNDKKKIRDEAIRLGGKESLAYRTLRNAGKLSPEFVE